MPDFGRWTSNGGDPSLNEVNRTDRFLDALAGERSVYSTDQGEAELAYLLAGWRDEVRQAPTTAPITERDAAAALDRATNTRERHRFSMAVVGSAAAALLCLGGFGSVVYGASPGDSLYGLRTSLFGEQQNPRDDSVVLAAQTEMAQVQQLIDQGQWAEAQKKLSTITTTVATVGDPERKQELVDQWQQLSVKVETQDINATVPPDAPPVVLPEVPQSDQPGTTTSSPTEATSPSSPTSATSSETTTSVGSTTSSAEPSSPAPQSTSSSQPQSPPLTQPPSSSAEPPSPVTSVPPVSQKPPSSPPVEAPAPPSGNPTSTTTTVAPPPAPGMIPSRAEGAPTPTTTPLVVPGSAGGE